MNFKRLSFLISSFLLFAQQMNGQYNPQQPPKLPQAPSSAALGKFGDYEVSMFTGVPSITIPVYTIETKGFSIPITLAYHASGIKLNEYPSWVGSGWALNSGGQIRRRMVGWPDEIAFGFLSGEPSKAIDINPTSASGDEYLNKLYEGQRDMGADIFSYSFPGHDGKFLFDRNNNYKAVLMPYAPLKITNTQAMQPLNFDITDESGNKYEFGKTIVEQSQASGGIQGMNVSSFMLEKMVSAKYTDTVFFTYQQQYEHAPLERSDSWVVEDMLDFQYTGWAHETYQPSQGTFSSNFSGSETLSQQPKEIFFSGGKLVFVPEESTREDFAQSGSTNKALKQIEVFRKSGNGYELVKTIRLYHSYFIEGNNTASKRLRLDKVEQLDASGVTSSVYNFEYNTNVVLPDVGPTMLSKDYWGYYNGKANSNLVPQTQLQYKPYAGQNTTSTITIGSSNSSGREPDELYAQANILKKIIYPTGGYSEFEYEGNKYLASDNSIKAGGGLRIKKIKSFDGSSSVPLIKTYKYGLNESGAGRKNFADDQELFSEEQTIEKWACLDVNQTCSAGAVWVDKKRRRTFYSNSIIENEGMDGASVVYPVVTEYTGSVDGLNGKRVIEFRDIPDALFYINYSSKPVVQTKFYQRGQPLKTTLYKRLPGGTYQPVSEESYQYNVPNFLSTPINAGLTLKKWVVKEPVQQTILNLPVSSGDWYHIDYYQVTDDNYPISKTVKTFHSDNPSQYAVTSSTTAYSNFNHQQPTTVTSVNSTGETVVAETRYPQDYITTGTTTNNTILDNLIDKHAVNTLIEAWTYKSQGNLVLSGGINEYKILTSGQPALDKQKRLRVSTPITNYQPALINVGNFSHDSRYETMLNFPTYNNAGDILEMKKEKDISEAYIWGYNNQYPVAKVVGKSYAEATSQSGINLTVLNSLTTTESDMRTELQKLRQLTNCFVTTYTYKPLVGITSETDPRGRTVYYDYDGFSRLVLIRDHDGKILKKICYNYAGQPENCTVTAPCVNLVPDWQNTTTALRCQTNSCGVYTGYQEQEQKDMNSCSLSHDSIRWVPAGYNPGACAPATSITLTSTNLVGVSGYVATYTNTSTGTVYTFNIPAGSGLLNLGCIPAGTYNLTIQKPSGNIALIFYSGCGKKSVSGTSATFYFVSVSSSTCNSIKIDAY